MATLVISFSRKESKTSWRYELKILVTGGAGFIGSHIVDAFIRDGHTVSIVDDLSSGRRENVNASAQFYECDIRDRAALENIMQEGRFEVVCHHAAQIDVRRSVADPALDASVNLLGLLVLMECCVKFGVRRVIFASSGGAIYGEQDAFPAGEEHPTRPLSPYGISKLASEHYLYYYHTIHGIDAIALRYANVYGPRQNPHGEAGVVAIFATKMLKSERPIVNGDGKQTRDYVFVEDVARANLKALQCRGIQAFNVGTGKETDVNEIYRLIKQHTGFPFEAEHGLEKKGEQRRSVIDAARINRVLGWSPTVGIEEGLLLTVAAFKVEEGWYAP